MQLYCHCCPALEAVCWAGLGLDLSQGLAPSAAAGGVLRLQQNAAVLMIVGTSARHSCEYPKMSVFMKHTQSEWFSLSMRLILCPQGWSGAVRWNEQISGSFNE